MDTMNRLARWLIVLAFGIAAHGDTLVIADFSSGDLSGWEAKAFAGETRYRRVRADGCTVLRAESDGSASGLVRRIRVDLTSTPILNWSWRVDNTLADVDEHSKAGDYPARLYVAVSGGVLFWRTRALNYVWSSHQPLGASWPNAFTGNARMLAVASGPAHAGEWRHYRRDVRADLRRLLDEDIDAIDAVAIMTDTDNSGQHVIAYYGDIYFSTD